MNRRLSTYIVPIFFVATAAAVLWLYVYPHSLTGPQSTSGRQTRVVTPQSPAQGETLGSDGKAEQMAYEDATVSKVSLGEGESLAAVITQDLDGDPQDEQIIAYRVNADSELPIHIAYIDYDENSGGYKKVWSVPTIITRQRTLSLYVKDLVGDRSVCFLAAGMDEKGEQTLTAFRTTSSSIGSGIPSISEPFKKILELKVDGSIVIHETERSQAYQLGIAVGKGFTISTYERDYESSNIMDQIEISYDYDPIGGLYQRVGTSRIPGTQIEQRRVRELLDGKPGRFEGFIEGLWYYAGADASENQDQFIYFDPAKREIIFYGENTQEVFLWQNSSPTRYGIYITSQNVSVTTLRRLIDIELESVESVRIKVFEDVKLKIGISGRWDGTYRKATLGNAEKNPPQAFNSFYDVSYQGSMGRISFSSAGTYTLTSETGTRSGTYAFFMMEDLELLELRRTEGTSSIREVFRVQRTLRKDAESTGQVQAAEELSLSKVKLGLQGIHDLNEGNLLFTKIN